MLYSHKFKITINGTDFWTNEIPFEGLGGGGPFGFKVTSTDTVTVSQIEVYKIAPCVPPTSLNRMRPSQRNIESFLRTKPW